MVRKVLHSIHLACSKGTLFAFTFFQGISIRKVLEYLFLLSIFLVVYGNRIKKNLKINITHKHRCRIIFKILTNQVHQYMQRILPHGLETFSQMHGCFNIQVSINVINHIKRIIYRKSFWENLIPSYLKKKLKLIQNKKNFLSLKRMIQNTSIFDILFNDEKNQGANSHYFYANCIRGLRPNSKARGKLF